MSTIESRLRELIERHTDPGGWTYPVYVPELLNVLDPGSAPMYPAELGYAATCGICAPNGDGHTKPWSQTKPADRFTVGANKETKETSSS